MKTKRNIYIIIVALFVLLAALVCTTYLYYVRHVEESLLYQAVSPYRDGKEDWKAPENASFAEDSGEALFLEGMDAFAGGEYEEAGDIFERALDAKSSDPALPAWLYYYINECTYQLKGAGDHDTVAKGLDAAGDYVPLANDRNMLWDMVYTVTMTPEADAKAIKLMEEYLEETENLELATWARLKNCIAMLEYINGEYAKAIRNFYDVELELQNVEMTSADREELQFAQEYIANIYYVFEDYERAAQLYLELADNTDEEDAAEGFSYYINMSTAYLELDDPVNAREAISMLEEILPRLDESIVAEVEASMNDVFADVCMAEKNYEEAETYLEKAEAFYENHAADVFYGGKYHVMLSRCQYMVHEGETEAAQAALEDMVATGEAAYYGLDKEVYELLVEIYQKTGQDEKLIEAYEYLLEYDQQFAQTVQREYLEFSEYYRDVNQLEYRNTRLSLLNTISILVIVIFIIILIFVLFLIRLLRKKNVIDQLTGVYNRKKLNLLMRKYRRSGTPANFGVVMMDIDYFKRYNDTYGHPAGDQVLKQVAAVLTESVRKNDLVIRYGGEEFLVLLNGLQAQTAHEVCQRVHKRLAERAIPHTASEVADRVTLSMGLCYQTASGARALDRLIECADECLYQAKEGGRNQMREEVL